MDDALRYAIEHGLLNSSQILVQVAVAKRKESLEKHPYSISKLRSGKWMTYLPAKNGGKRIQRVRKTRKEIEDLIVDYWEEQTYSPTIHEVFEEWNDRKLELRNISSATHDRNICVFKRHFKVFGKQRIKNITANDIEDFLEEQIPKYNLSAKSFANLKSITRGMLKRAKRRKLITFDVEVIFDDMDTTDRAFSRRIKEEYEEVFNKDEMKIMIEYLITHQDQKNLGILLMFVTGIRIGELVALKHDVFNGNTFVVRRMETKYKCPGKGNIYAIKEFPKTNAGVRTVVIPQSYSWLSEKLQNMNPDSEYIFLNDSGGRMTTNCIRSRLKRICRDLGIYEKSPHKIRKTYATILLDNNLDQKLIIGQMGHTDISCTENHYHINRRELNEKIQIISSLKEFQSLDYFE